MSVLSIFILLFLIFSFDFQTLAIGYDIFQSRAICTDFEELECVASQRRVFFDAKF